MKINTQDLISRQDAIYALEQGFKDVTKGIDKLSPTYGLTKAITGIYKCYIGKLSPIQFEPPWIPVTERLPDKLDYCLVSGNNSVWLGRYESGRFWGVLSGHALDTVIAWMPLPEVYKEVEE